MLPAFIQKRHDYIDTSCLTSDGGDHTFQVLVMIVRGHVVDMSCKRIGQTVVAYIYHKVDILSANGFVNNALGFPGAKTRHFCVDQIGIPLISVVNNIIFIYVAFFLPPLYDVVVYPAAHLFAAVKSNDSKRSDGYVFQNTVITA